MTDRDPVPQGGSDPVMHRSPGKTEDILLIQDTDGGNNMMEEITLKPIGIIYTQFKEPAGMPIQSSAAEGIRGRIELEEQYVPGLADLDGFSHIYLLYHLHLSESYSLRVIPFLDNRERGVFATRAPRRPNPIGLSVVKLNSISANILEIENVDIVDGTPLLDIKPYIPEMESTDQYRIGWLTGRTDAITSNTADERFK